MKYARRPRGKRHSLTQRLPVATHQCTLTPPITTITRVLEMNALDARHSVTVI